jgi:cytochrome c biogenesis protein CcdA
MATLVLSFIAGLITMFNPCVLPLAPIIIAGARAENPRGPIALAAGLALTFGITGGIVASLGAEIGDIAAIRMPAAVLMIPIGLALLIPMVGHWAEWAMRPLVRLGDTLQTSIPQAGLWGNFAIGAILALVWAPCVGPTLGAAIVLASTSGTLPLAMLNMMIFAIGTATSLLIAGYLLRRIATAGKRFAGQSAKIGRMAFGALLIVIGVVSITGLDQRIEGTIDNHLPDWFIRFVTQV